MNPDMGIDDKLLIMEQKWQDSRLSDILEKHKVRDNLGQRIIQLEDKNFDLNSEIRILNLDSVELTKSIIWLEKENLRLSSQVKVMKKRLIRYKIQSFIDRIFKRLGYIHSTG